MVLALDPTAVRDQAASDDLRLSRSPSDLLDRLVLVQPSRGVDLDRLAVLVLPSGIDRRNARVHADGWPQVAGRREAIFVLDHLGEEVIERDTDIEAVAATIFLAALLASVIVALLRVALFSHRASSRSIFSACLFAMRATMRLSS